ncbi:hypothetical protein B2K11_04135 [Microbacterium sp. B35-30]|nr:hypothetical protein B2K11_04135 [Microbacterium sp. B35-30]
MSSNPDEASLGRHAVRGASHTLTAQLGRVVLQIATTVILARLLEADDFGLFAMVSAFTGVALVIGDFGLSLAAVQARELGRAVHSNLFWINLSLGCGLFAVYWLGAYPLAAFYNEPLVVAVTQGLAFVFLINGFSAQMRVNAIRQMRFGQIALVDFGAQIGALTGGIVLALVGAEYWALVGAQIAQAIVAAIGLTIVGRWLPGWPNRRGSIRAMAGFGAHTSAAQILSYAAGTVDKILIGRFIGPSSLGYYDRAFQLLQLPMTQLLSPLTNIAVPILSKVDADDQRLARTARSIALILSYGFGTLLFLIIALATPVVEIALGHDWSPSVPILQILCIGGLFQAIGYLYFWLFLSRGLTAMQLRYSVIGRSIQIALIVACVPLGVLGVAGGVVAGQAINWLILTVFALRHTGVAVKVMLSAMWRPIVANLVVAGAVSLAGTFWLSSMLAVVWLAIGLALYTALFAVILIVPAFRGDVAHVLRIVRSRGAQLPRFEDEV